METTNGWHKGSRSGHTGACVEAKRIGGIVHIKDSKQNDDAARLDEGGFTALKAFIRATSEY